MTRALEARGLVKAFGAVVAVDGVDLSVDAGSCVGLLGPNGAGKTTTIEMLEGLIEPDAGSISVLGLDWRRDAREIRERIGVSLQETRFPDKLTVDEALRVFRSFYRRGRDTGSVLATVGLEGKRHARIVHLSGGQLQRLALGCALVGEPELLFLDEPTTGLDPQARRRVWEIVEQRKQAGVAVLLTTHYMDEAERLADHLVIVDQGRVIAEGSPDAIISRVAGASVLRVRAEAESSGEAVAPDPGWARELPGVQAVRVDGPALQLAVADARPVLPRLIERLTAEGLAVAELETHRATLEDVFVHLTGRHLRDA